VRRMRRLSEGRRMAMSDTWELPLAAQPDWSLAEEAMTSERKRAAAGGWGRPIFWYWVAWVVVYAHNNYNFEYNLFPAPGGIAI
jgi:hypothetical protein